MLSTRILGSLRVISSVRITPTSAKRLALHLAGHGSGSSYSFPSPPSLSSALSSSHPSFASSSFSPPSFRPFSSSASLHNRFNDNRRQKKPFYQSLAAKYQPKIMREIDNFSRREFISGISYRQIFCGGSKKRILLLPIILSFFFLQNSFGLFVLLICAILYL